MGNIFRNLALGFGTIANFQSIIFIFIGMCVGILGGAIPGISPSMAVALLLPITYSLSPVVAMVMLMGISTVFPTGQSVSSTSTRNSS